MAAPLALVGGSLLANMLSSSGKKEDIDRVDAKLDAGLREQSQYNMKMAEMVSGQGQQLRNLESSNDRLSSRTDKLSDLFGESSLQLGRVQSDTSSLRRDQDRYGARFDQFQSNQSGINMDLARRGASMEAGFSLFSEQQRSFNDGIKLETAGMQKRLGEHSTGLEVMKSRTDGLQHYQDQISSNLTRVDGKVDQFLVIQNKYNNDFSERSSRMEENLRMSNEYQGQFNKGIDSRTVALQESLGNTSTRVELVHARSDHLQRGLNELSLDHRQTNQRIDQFNSDYNQRLQLLSDGTVRNEERQLSFMNNQTSLNDKLLNRTDALTSKFYETEGKLDQVNHRTDTLFKGQDKIDSEMRLERQINENRLREQIKHNETLSNNYSRVDERQSCFINDQKTRNDQIINQTETIRDKLGQTSKDVDFVNYHVKTLQNAQQKVELDQKDMDKRLHVVEHCTEGLRNEQKQINDKLTCLLANVTEITTRMKTMESQLEGLQAGYNRLNEMCIKLEAAGGSLGKGPDEPRNDGMNDPMSGNKMPKM